MLKFMAQAARSARLLAAAGFASPFHSSEGIEFVAQQLP
jgi:hypothetical protein